MHDSVNRLYQFAKDKTSGTKSAVHDFASLGVLLGVSSAVMTNWKARGVSRQGALDAQRVFGCSADWVLTGVGPNMISGSASRGSSQGNPPAAWPFRLTSFERFDNIPLEGRGVIEKAVLDAVVLCEKAGFTKRKTA